MSLIHIATRGPSDWRERLADPVKHWQRTASAMETAVSWELATRSKSRLPDSILKLINNSILGDAELLFAVVEHKVPLEGTGGDSQCDVWALVKTLTGTVSLTVEAKAKEPFGDNNETLEKWLASGETNRATANRNKRWEDVKKNLPSRSENGPIDYTDVPYQILQRCAAAVIEARRFGLKHAACIIQSFGAPEKSYGHFEKFCHAVGIDKPERNCMKFVKVGDDILCGIGWAECDLATDKQLASVVEGG